jgi:hypothetical protein
MFGTKTSIGWRAKDFALKGIDGKIYSLADVRGPKGTSLSSSVITVLT